MGANDGVRRLPLALAALLLAAGLAGCIGGDDRGGDLADQPPSDEAATPPTTAIMHRAGPGNATAMLVANASRMTGPDTPLPRGLIRSTGLPNFEPTLGVTSDGTLFMSAENGGTDVGGVPPGVDYTSVIRSTDDGRTWEDVTARLGTVSTPPESRDPYLHVDRDTDRVFDVDMQKNGDVEDLLEEVVDQPYNRPRCNWIQWSDDGGESWDRNPLGCGQPPFLDHPTLFTGPPRERTTVGYDNVVYLCANRWTDAMCATSLDGGRSFGPFRTALPGHNEEGDACNASHGHGTTGPGGRAYLAKRHCEHPMVGVTEDDGLTWQTSIVTDAVEVRPDAHDVEVATDAAGNVYALWVSPQDLPYLAVSTDHARTWSEPVMIAPPEVRTAVFPKIAAGDTGRVALAYYGTSNETAIDEMGDDTTWTAYLATIPNATAPEPLVLTAPLHPPDDPIARGPCDDDNRCDGVGDFIDVVIGGDGRPWTSMVDVCHDDCNATTGNDRAIGVVGTLSQGLPLRGEAAALPPLSGNARNPRPGAPGEDPEVGR